MVPSVAKSGHSFKGAMAYYLHDKGESGQHVATAERVAWTEVRNLMTDDPQAAKRIMIATAKQADELKARAGVKATGRKSTAHVYAYSLAWHPDEGEQLDRAEMVRAVDQSLKVLGAEGHQALIVCHVDQKHPHVHVILNRVDPQTGKMLSTSNDHLKLSEWANEYERERGQILTPKREEKRQLREQFAEQSTRQQYAQDRRNEQTERPKADKSKAAMLKEFQEAQKVEHSQQWRDLSERNKKARSAIYDTYAQRINAAAVRHKTESKPIWASYFKDARTVEKAFNAREKNLGGVVANAIIATMHQKQKGEIGPRGMLSATFGNALSSQARAAAFAERMEMNRQQMAARLRTVLDGEVSGLKERRAAALVTQRSAFEKARADLIAKQDLERGKIREAWSQIYADRGKDPRARSRTYREKIERKTQWQADRQASKEQRAEQKPRTDFRRRNPKTTAQPPRQIEREEVLRPQKRPTPLARENPMKDAFENARRVEPRAATKPVSVSTPAPAPAPSGALPVRPSTAQQMPRVDKAKAWAATPEGKKATAPAAPTARKDWSATKAAPPQDAPAVKKDWSKASTPQPTGTPDPAKPRPRQR